MNKNVKLLPLVVCLALLINVGGVLGWGPSTHTYISDQALQDSRLSGSNIATIIKANKQCFDAGYMITDSLLTKGNKAVNNGCLLPN